MPSANSKTPTQAPQMIPLEKIHDLPNVFIPKPKDKELGSMVLSVQSSGVKEAVILRLRDDGEYQLLNGYRRRRASELAEKKEIPALVYEMTMQEAVAYRKALKDKPDTPIPGKLIDSADEKGKSTSAEAPAVEKDGKDKEGEAPAAPGTEGLGESATESPTAEKNGKDKEGEAPAAPGTEGPGESAAENPVAEKDGKGKEGEAPAAPGTAGPGESAAENPAAEKDGKGKEGEAPAAPGTEGPGGSAAENPAAEKDGKSKQQTTTTGKGAKKGKLRPTETEAKKQKKGAKAEKPDEAPALEAATKGPAGTSIKQIFEDRLAPPDEAARKALPVPGDDESIFITLHPAYLEKSKFNTFSVDTESENFKELKKSIELVGIKDPVLARFNNDGKLEILSGQRRHIAATMLNQAVPTIIQKIDDADAKIIVADGNLHRDKISSYDLSRALRMKMEGMKQKGGRRKKGYSATELHSDVALAQEMGMSVAKLNRVIRLSEAVKGVCDLVDEGKLSISVAAEISYLKTPTQESLLHLMQLDYKPTNDRIGRMKKAEVEGKKLDDITMRNILTDKDIAQKQPEPLKQPESANTPTTGAATAEQPTIPSSPDVPAPEKSGETPAVPGEAPAAPASKTKAAGEDDPFEGAQERPEVTKVILTGDRLRKYFPDVTMTPRQIEESVYEALEERRQRQEKQQQRQQQQQRPQLLKPKR